MPRSAILTSPRGRFPELDKLVGQAQAKLAHSHQTGDPAQVAQASSRLTGLVTGRGLGTVLVLVDPDTLPFVIAAVRELPALSPEQERAVRALLEPR